MAGSTFLGGSLLLRCRYIIKQLSRSERQSFLEFAPDYFRHMASALALGRGASSAGEGAQQTTMAKVLGMFQVTRGLLCEQANPDCHRCLAAGTVEQAASPCSFSPHAPP